METITITRALAELKHLAKRIKKHTDSGNFIVLVTKANRSNINLDEFIRTSTAEYQSVGDLITRYHQIKRAIIKSNAITEVRLGKHTYTIAEIIERRQALPLTQALLDKLRVQRDAVNRNLEANNAQMEMELQKLLETQFGSSAKTSSAEIETISKTFRESRKSVISDPLGIDEEIKQLSEEIDEFEHEANFVLSESNATTKVTI